MGRLNGSHFYFPLLLVAAFSIASCAPSSPEPTITPQMTTRQVIAAFRAVGVFAVDDTFTMSGADYQGAPQICPGEHFTIMSGDTGDYVLVLQCATSSRLGQLSDFYKQYKTLAVKGGTLIVIPNVFLSRSEAQALDWQIQHCAENNLCAGK